MFSNNSDATVVEDLSSKSKSGRNHISGAFALQNISEFGKEATADDAVLGVATAVKRAADIVLGTVALLVLSPILLMLFFTIKLESKGSALVFKAVRGSNGPVAIMKFRTRAEDSPYDITRVGAVLRKYDIDRLPFLLSVVNGSVSLFGRDSIFGDKIAIGLSDEEYSLNGYAEFLKRPIDIVLVILASPFLLLLIGIPYLMVKRDGGPGFYGQLRVGHNGKLFRCWKVRSMQVNADEMLKEYLAANPEAAKEWEENRKLDNDPRITKLGNFMRKTSLDEFPQFWNVLRGEMSLVGPRPVPADELKKYGSSDTFYKSVRPGVTGLWQVSGRNEISYDERVALDVNYASKLNMFGDITIIFKTVETVIKRTGK